MSHLLKATSLESQDTLISKQVEGIASYSDFNNQTSDNYTALVQNTNFLRTALLSHPVYTQVNDLVALRVFMESHIFAVWDFMTLVKTLQRRLTCVDIPWIPAKVASSARFINEIVLSEETDEVKPGYYISHFELYLLAMEEVGANCRPMQAFLECLHQGDIAEQALISLPIPATTKQFVLNTLSSVQGSTHEVAATLLFGREDIIPKMFSRLLEQVEQAKGVRCHAFRLYLERHMHLDEESHAPMGKKLLINLCENDVKKWEEAQRMTEQALRSRHTLWDGIEQAIYAAKSNVCFPAASG
ncbi:hypothetical protein NIES2100_00790 [Calothrix sp. NIES-2100]|uniref:DUF3050 domain-containing protein n=1 Tax=Calothrix sp. NIES-2100 TaxID=1954172 RepID=UPI000B61E0B7|nr:hypothetical protein NIES2100_00790 [Calothrix sp. NIES-2100]